jgi:hypothetical protein
MNYPNENTIVALDIINPFDKTVKINGLRNLVDRINNINAYDKVGSWMYEIEDNLENGVVPLTDYVYNWLVHIDSLRQTKKKINFVLDLSGIR